MDGFAEEGGWAIRLKVRAGILEKLFDCSMVESTLKSINLATEAISHEVTPSPHIWLSTLCASWCLGVFVANHSKI